MQDIDVENIEMEKEDINDIVADPKFLNSLERQEKKEEDDYEKCLICFDDIETYFQLPCGHGCFFHDNCIIKWLKMNNTCPECRCEFPKNPLYIKKPNDEYIFIEPRSIEFFGMWMRTIGRIMINEH